MVIYELHVGSFLFDPGSSNGRGDFNTVIGKLAYLADLGINTIQVMPSDEFPGTSSFGYNPADIFAIETNYGGPNGFEALVDAAHSHGIAVIYDLVYNHLGPSDLDLWQFDGWSENGAGGIYFYNDWRRATPWADTRPDYGRGEVRQFLRDNALFWLEEHRCDGLRFDATNYIRNVWGSNGDPSADLADGWGLLQWINSEVQGRQPWKITIAEDVQDNEWLTKSQGAGGAGFSSQWGAGFMHTLRGAVITPDDDARDMRALAGVIGQRFNANAFQRVTTPRTTTRTPRRMERRGCRSIFARPSPQLLRTETLDLGRHIGLYRTWYPDDLHGSGIPGVGGVVGRAAARLVESRPLQRHSHALSRPDPIAAKLV